MLDKKVSALKVSELELLITTIIRRESKIGTPAIELRYNSTETAKILECTPSTLRSWRKRGLISATKIGKKNYYLESSIRAFIDNKK